MNGNDPDLVVKPTCQQWERYCEALSEAIAAVARAHELSPTGENERLIVADQEIAGALNSALFEIDSPILED